MIFGRSLVGWVLMACVIGLNVNLTASRGKDNITHSPFST